MSAEPPRRVNIASPPFASSADDPEGFRTRGFRLGGHVGASTTGMSVYELPPGQAICPYHYENPEEEWLLVLDGRPTLRHPGGEDLLEPWDRLLPLGPRRRPCARNDTDVPTRVLMFSDRSTVAASVYPDSARSPSGRATRRTT